MDRMISCTIDDKEYWLNYSIAVYFDLNDKYGSLRDVMDLLSKESKETVDCVIWLFVRMQNDAELLRRELGYDKGVMLKAKELTAHMAPIVYADMRDAVVKAIQSGYMREKVDKHKVIDLTLQELEAKK